ELRRPACDRELVPLSQAQRQAQPVAAHVGSLSRDRSERGSDLRTLPLTSDRSMRCICRSSASSPARRTSAGAHLRSVLLKATSYQAEELAPRREASAR